MSRYAAKTEVSPDQSLAEIRRTLTRYGATAFAYGEDEQRFMVAFQMNGRQFRITCPAPQLADYQFTETRGLRRSPASVRAYHARALAQRWRALGLYVKAKLEAVESQVVDLETAFLPHMVLPSGQTLAEWAGPQLQVAIEAGRMPPFLPLGPSSG
jgi:hypothetical protein